MTEPICQRSPISASLTSMPSVVKFSPNCPLADVQAQPLRPDVEVLSGERINGLVDAAVELGVGDLITLDAQRTHGNGPLDLRLDDRCALQAAGPLGIERGTDIDRKQTSRHSAHPRKQMGGYALRYRLVVSVSCDAHLIGHPRRTTLRSPDAAPDDAG